MAPDTTVLVARILNSAWMVRHYARGARLRSLAPQRDKAIRALGLTVRDCFNASDDFETLLTAVVDGLTPDNSPRF